MRFYSRILVLFLFLAASACSSAEQKPSNPMETLEAYARAVKKKDTTAMKLLLSEASLKMAEQEARAQNVTVDDIVKRETLFGENQTIAEFRNRRVEEDKATIEVKDSIGIWNTVHFAKEEGVWKIDKQGFANQIEKDAEESNRKIDELINQGRQP
jgi:hypothetical protein